jgi:hypothetical protein
MKIKNIFLSLFIFAIFIGLSASSNAEDGVFSTDFDRDGFEEVDDCNNEDAMIFPGAEEVCDNVDNNCDGMIDEGVLLIFYMDVDGDGYGSPTEFMESCDPPLSYVVDNTDCDDNDASINPEATEVPRDGIDNDCDGSDLGDVDGDGFSSDDCDDDNALVYPGAEEIPYDGIDNDCDGSDLADMDGDGYDSYLVAGADCDDNDASVWEKCFIELVDPSGACNVNGFEDMARESINVVSSGQFSYVTSDNEEWKSLSTYVSGNGLTIDYTFSQDLTAIAKVELYFVSSIGGENYDSGYPTDYTIALSEDGNYWKYIKAEDIELVDQGEVVVDGLTIGKAKLVVSDLPPTCAKYMRLTVYETSAKLGKQYSLGLTAYDKNIFDESNLYDSVNMWSCSKDRISNPITCDYGCEGGGCFAAGSNTVVDNSMLYYLIAAVVIIAGAGYWYATKKK